ncbi:microcin-processing peptidase 1 [Plasticicumulans lactativorans]|uniref:Microcin-processing peptidase 1 n=1 Tax=Plasticicumulans lactativorans TaxID=1133106 RepID=A0A4R2LTA1_9GAMM|nr:metalloprotease PmbA [Plasticicumulans lactativorans]TCO83012.1 microcin-processing peptidase 1 [Plasticicumulans lactativorans]
MTTLATPDSPPSRTLPERARLDGLVGDILAQARALGASAAEAAVSFSTGLSVTVRLGEVETLEYQRDRGLGVTVYFGTRKGSASTSDWRPQALRDTVRAACDIARHTAEDPCAGLADAADLARDPPDLDLYHPWDIRAEDAIALATACEDTARATDPRITNSEGASVGTHAALVVYGNSLGFLGGYPATRHSLSCSVIAQGAEGGMERDHWYTSDRDPAVLEAAAAVGRRAAERALRRLHARRLGTCSAPVLFAPELARGLVGHFLGAIRGGALYRKASFLVDALGQPVFAPHVQIREAPHLPRALGSAPFDSEGVATRPRDIVRDGVLQGYVLDTYSARRLGLHTTGNAGGVHNVIVEPGADDADALLARMGRGLLVTELMGHGVNAVTGDYSRGAAGFWVEDGRIAYPVHEITIAGRLPEMFRDLVAVGRDVDTRGNIRCGSILLERMTIAGE